MFKNLSVQSKMLTIVAVVTVLFGATVIGLGMVARHHVVASMQTELERSSKVITEYFDSRYRQLDAGLNSLVDSPEIRAVLTTEGIDHDTQLMSITDLQSMLGADAILYCNSEGRTLARTDDPFDEESMVDGIPIVAGALEGETTQGFWECDGTPLLAIAFPVTIDEEVLGVVCAGMDVNADAEAIKSLLLRDLVVYRGNEVLTDSLAGAQAERVSSFASQSASSIESMADVKNLPVITVAARADVPQTDAVAASVAVSPKNSESLQAAVIIPEQVIYGFYHDFQRMLVVLGLITIGISLLITFKIASIISNQVQMTLGTLETVASGDLSTRLLIDTKDEFGRIANSLNTAIAASASTLDTLAVRNRDTQMLLDAVEQGFFTVDSDGIMSDERSGAVDRIFGEPDPKMHFVDLIARFDAYAADWIEMGLDDVFLEFMPVEVTLDQLPSRFVAEEKTFSIQYTPVRVDDQLTKIAIVISDITALVANEKLEAIQREMMAMVHRMADDRSGFLEFFQESTDLVESLRDYEQDDIRLVKRRVHTLKGNTAIYGLLRVSEKCHYIEDFIAENDKLPNSTAWQAMFESWDSARENLARITGDQEKGIEIEESDFDALMEEVLSKTDHGDLAVRMAAWKLEPTALRLARVSEQVRSLAKRLGKGDIDVRQSGGDLRLDPKQWSEFWSSFVHVVRNAVDHGLETPEERTAAGKPGNGRVYIGTAIEDREFVISLRDDGRGIDWLRITEVAYEKGLPAETHEDLVNALFADGVTTAKEVTDTSGRGVGMAAVKESCERLGGKISIDSELGSGTTFRFIFPVMSMAPKTMGDLNNRSVEQPERALGSGVLPNLVAAASSLETV